MRPDVFPSGSRFSHGRRKHRAMHNNERGSDTHDERQHSPARSMMNLSHRWEGRSMESRHDELRDELVAILGAARELSTDTDKQLADAFIRYLEIPERQSEEIRPIEEPHQPHYSLKLAGGSWGAALMFLVILLTVGHPTAFNFLLASIVILSLVFFATRIFLYMARRWRVPHIRVTVAPAEGKAQGRG